MKFKILNSKLHIFIIVFLLLATAFEASAQFGFTRFLGGFPGQELGIDWFFKLLRQLTCYFYRLAVITFGTMLIVYGFMFLKSRGNPQGMTEARKALTWGLVGGLVIFMTFSIIMSIPGVLSFFGLAGQDYPLFSCS